jgi:type VI secretion system protein ImpA
MTIRLPELDELLRPLDAESPCGPELDYDADFIALERLLEGTPERQYGDTIIAAEGPDFAQVLQHALRLLERSRDLRLLVTSTRALLRTRGPAGLVEGLGLLEGLLEQRWEDLHPRLEIDGEHDPLPRANALAPLAASEGLLGDLRSARLQTRLMGTLEIAELERAAAGREGATLTRGQLQQLLTDEHIAGNPALTALRQLGPLLRRIDALLRGRLGVENAPDFKPLIAVVDAIAPTIEHGEAANSTEGEHGVTDSTGSVASNTAQGLPALRSREDAMAVLEAVCQFLERHEPANPAPLLIRRARSLIGQDFLSILRELAPDGVAQAEHLAGLRS